jgi:hypothetical protein
MEREGPWELRPWVLVDPSKIPSRTDPEVCKVIDDGDGYLTLHWSAGAYDINLSDISRPEDLMWTIYHIGRKSWSDMTPSRIAALIEIVARKKGWPMYGRAPHPNEAPKANHDVAAERAKMTPEIRYAVIRRDGYRCRACGFSVQDGAHLHVDHVQPVSRGGETVIGNLQTLCTVCNIGKGAQ